MTGGPTRSGRPDPYDQLKTEILSGDLRPGDALNESALAATLEVSRTPIREALVRLTQDGLAVRTERGMQVRERSPEEVLDIYSVRILLESSVARMAAERRSDLDVVAIRKAQAEYERGDGTDPVEWARRNRRFHRAIWRASHNEPLSDLLERVDLHLGRYPATTLAVPGRWKASIDEHANIVDAVEQRDADAAAAAADAHFTAAREIRLRIWTEEEDPT